MPARIAAPLCDDTGKFQNKQDHNYWTKPIEKRAGHTTKKTSSSNSGPGPGIIYIQAPLMIAHVTTKANSQFRQDRTRRGETRWDERCFESGNNNSTLQHSPRILGVSLWSRVHVVTNPNEEVVEVVNLFCLTPLVVQHRERGAPLTSVDWF